MYHNANNSSKPGYVATQISARNVWPKLAKVAGIGGTCGAEDATKEMERGPILCTNFILLNQQVVRRPRFVCCCSVLGSLISRIFHAPFSQFYYYQVSKKSFKKLVEILSETFYKAVRIFQRYVFIHFKRKIFQKNISRRKKETSIVPFTRFKRKYPLLISI